MVVGTNNNQSLERLKAFELDDINFHLKAQNNPKILKILEDEGTSASTISSVAKVIRGILNVVEAAAETVDASDAKNGLGLVGDIIKLASLGKNCHDLKNTKEKLKISSLAIGATTSGLTLFKILNYFKVITLSDLATHLGKIPVVGTAAAKWLPFGNILSILDIAKAGIDIALSKREINKLKVKISHGEDKKSLWKSIERKGYVKTEYARQKIDCMNEKLEKKYKTNEKQLATVALEKLDRAEAAIDKLQNLKEEPESLMSSLKIKRATKRQLKLQKRCNNAVTEYLKAKASTEKYAAKIETWEKMSNAPRVEDMEPETDEQANAQAYKERLVRTARLKVEKWDLKSLLKRKDIRNEKRSIAFNVFLITVLAASIILTALAFTAIPGVGIALAVAFLAIPAIGLGMSLYKRYKKRPTYNAVPLTSFA